MHGARANSLAARTRFVATFNSPTIPASHGFRSAVRVSARSSRLLQQARQRLVLLLAGMLLVAGSIDAVAAAEGSSETVRPARELAGLWVDRQHLGPELRGDLLLLQRGQQWELQIGAFSAPGQVNENRLHFTLPGERGEFRLPQPGPNSEPRRGYWLQPTGPFQQQRYATPVNLERVAAELTASATDHGAPQTDRADKESTAAWRGQVRPLEETFSLALRLVQREDGSVGGFVRNPELNAGRNLRFDQAVMIGQRVELRRSADEQENRGQDSAQQVVLAGQYHPQEERLSLDLPYAGLTLDLRRADASTEPLFTPRPAQSRKPWQGDAPLALDDGWPTAAPTHVGLDSQRLAELVQQLGEQEVSSVYSPYLHALLVARGGKLVVEEYFYGHHREQTHDTRSAGKSLSTTLAGMVIDDGLLNVQTPVYELLGHRATQASQDLRRNRMQLRHLMSMSPGWACDDGDYESPGNEDRMQNQSEQPDWVRYALELPMAREPGSEAIYCTAGIHVLAAALTQSTGLWVPELLDQRFAQALDIDHFHHNLSPTGQGYLGGGIRLRPRDLLKLGQVFVDDGRWRGKQIVSKQWITQATAVQAGINEADDYGYGWWRKSFSVEGQQIRTFYASGNGGQLLIVVPQLDMVVLFMAGNYGNYGTWSKYRDQLLPQYLLSAALGSAGG